MFALRWLPFGQVTRSEDWLLRISSTTNMPGDAHLEVLCRLG
jgi:hypothetical protein